MATTTNYGWTTPNDTDLVKDGAAAIRTLGSSVDTTTKALNPSTTLGDIEYRSATANTNTRLPIGTSGQILAVSAGVPAWTTPAAGGGMTLLSTTALSGASTTINSISTAYTSLMVLVENAYAGGNIDLGLQLNADTGSNYAFSGISTANGLNVRGNLNTTEFTFNDFAPSGQQTKNNGYAIFNLPRYSTTSGNQFMTVEYKARWASNYSGGTFTCAYAKSAAITSMTFKAGNSTWTAGNVLIYGVN
jgi:hypothetical protein